MLCGKVHVIQSFEMNCKVCQNLSVKNPNLSFFRFPSDYNRCKDWAERCSILPIFEKYGPGKFYKSYRICSEHFESKHIVFDGRKKKLLGCAVPKEFHREEGLEGITDGSKTKYLQPKQNSCFIFKPFRNLCRFCAEENTKLTDIFSWRGKTLKLEEKIKVFPITVNKQDKLPLRICRRCILKISKFYDFVTNCLSADAKLKKILRLNEQKIFGNDGKSREKQQLSNTKKINEGKPSLHHDSNAVVHTTQHQEKYSSAKAHKIPDLLKIRPGSRASGQPQHSPRQIHDVNEAEKYLCNKEEKVTMSYSGQDEFSGTQRPYSSKESIEDKSSTSITKNYNKIYEKLNINEYTCSKCLKHFCDLEILESHEKAHSLQPDEQGRFICQTCGKVFPNKYRLNEHNRVHTGEYPYKCSMCSKRFHKRGLLRQHLVVHETVKRYVCYVCDLRSSRRGNLIKHLENHYKKIQSDYVETKRNKQTYSVTGEATTSKRRKLSAESGNTGFFPTEEHPPVTDSKTSGQEFQFMCGLCRKQFHQLDSLEAHIQLHNSGNFEAFHGQGENLSDERAVDYKKSTKKTRCRPKGDERNFQCEECGLKFKRKDTLTNHFRIHTGERPYMCKVCGFTFKQRGDCLKHERNHSKDDDYQIL